MAFTLKTKPAVEPVTLEEAKDHLRVDENDEDALISELIKAARSHIENVIHRPLVTQTWVFYADMFECVMELKANLQSVSSVKYIDSLGVETVVDAADYDIDAASVIGTVYSAYDKTWPDARDIKNAVEIEFIAGYGIADDVPASIKSSMLLLIGHWFVNRESIIVGASVADTPMAVDMLLNPYRVVYL